MSRRNLVTGRLSAPWVARRSPPVLRLIVSCLSATTTKRTLPLPDPTRQVRTLVIPLILVLAALFVFVPGCKNRTSPTLPPSKNTAPTTPRIAALSPAVAEILRDLGQSGSIVARHAYDQWSDQSLPACGEQGRIDYELLLSVRPTTVIVQDTATPARLQSLAEEQKWQVKNLAILSLDDIRAAVRYLAALFPESDATAIRQKEIEAQMDRAWKPRDSLDPTVLGRVLLLASVDPPSALGPGSFHYQILRTLGGESATTNGSPYIVMDAEQILKLAPDAIVLILPRTLVRGTVPADSPGSRDVETVRTMLGAIGKLDIPAVRNGHLALIDDPAAHLPGTSMIRLADELADILAGWAKRAK